MKFPHTVTVYNVATETDRTTFEDKLTNHITVLEGVFLDATKAVNVRTSGLEGADAVSLYIPRGVKATDPETGASKSFVGPWEFEHSDSKDKSWTLSINGTAGQTFFCKGKVVEPDKTFEQISAMYDDVYNVTKVDDKDFGRLAHWMVGGA